MSKLQVVFAIWMFRRCSAVVLHFSSPHAFSARSFSKLFFSLFFIPLICRSTRIVALNLRRGSRRLVQELVQGSNWRQEREALCCCDMLGLQYTSLLARESTVQYHPIIKHQPTTAASIEDRRSYSRQTIVTPSTQRRSSRNFYPKSRPSHQSPKKCLSHQQVDYKKRLPRKIG